MAIGSGALFLNSTGSWNTASGEGAGWFNQTGSNNTFVGAKAEAWVDGLANATAIGYNAIVNASNKVRIGNSSVTVIEGQVPFSSVSDAREKREMHDTTLGLDFCPV